jgi:predicted DNA-binding transcriptional regulator YafY
MDTSQTPRLYFIELLANWEGKVNSADLGAQFDVSRQQCSAAFKAYKEAHPNNLHYDASQKSYLPTATFAPCHIDGDAHQYLHWLQTKQLLISPSSENKTKQAWHYALALPPRHISPAVMRGLVAAVKQQRRLEVDYVSLNNPSREGRIIAPHSFINTGSRWHLRAYCEKSQQFRDFVLSRFRGIPELLDKSRFHAQHDIAWNTKVTLVIQPDPRLEPAKRQVIEQDYQMQNGHLHITTLGCMVNYLLRELQISTKTVDLTPEAQQCVIVNFSDIKQWLFEG